MLREAAVLSVVIYMGFRIAGVPRTQNMLRKWANRYQSACASNTAAEQIGAALRAVSITRRYTHASGNCLLESLTLWAILQRRGIQTDLRVGFRKSEGRIQGHAWLEHHAFPINETEAKAASYVAYDGPMDFDLHLPEAEIHRLT